MTTHAKNIKVFSGTSHPKLASQIASALGIPLGNAEIGHFSDGEIEVSINETVRGCDVFVVQSTCAPVNDNIMELLVLIDAFKRASAGRITAVIPYFGYARQDRKSKARDPISAKLCADIITTAGANRVLTMDLHAPQLQGFFNIPVDHLLGVPALTPYFNELLSAEGQDAIAVSPDLGSVTRCRNFAQRTDLPIAIVDKRRQKANVSEVMNIIGDVKDKIVILVDDLIDTAGTLCNAAEALLHKGGAREIYACATHGVLSGPAYERIQQSVIKKLVLLDTIPLRGDRPADKIVSIPVAGIFAEAIERIYEEISISTLFI